MLPQGRTVRSIFLEGERVAEATWSGLQLTMTPILCDTGERGSKARPGKEERGGSKVYLRSRCFSSLSYSDSVNDLEEVFCLN